MKIKESFELIYGQTGNIHNILPVNSNTLAAFELDKEDKYHMKILASSYAKSKNLGDSIIKQADSCIIARLDDYPLPGFVTKDGVAGINVSVLPSSFVSDFSSADIYALMTYSICLRSFFLKKPFDPAVEDLITEYLISAFVMLFGKKHGLLGSYSTLLPLMKVIIGLYVKGGMMNQPLTESNINKVCNKYFVDINDLKMKYDLNTTIGFLKTIKDNNIIPISENLFSTTIINVAQVSSLPMFEDVSRFFATLICTEIAGNSIFSKFWRKVNRRLYERLIYLGLQNARRSM